MYQVTMKTMADGLRHRAEILPYQIDATGDAMRNAVLEATSKLFGEEARFLFNDSSSHNDHEGLFPGVLAFIGDDGTLGQVFVDVLAEVRVTAPATLTNAISEVEKSLGAHQTTGQLARAGSR